MNEELDIEAIFRAHRLGILDRARCFLHRLRCAWDTASWAIDLVEKRDPLDAGRDVSWWRRFGVRVAIRVRVLASSDDHRDDFVEAMRAASDHGYCLWNTEWPLLETLAEVLLLIERKTLCCRITGAPPAERASRDLLVRNFNKVIELRAMGSISATRAAHILEHALVSTNWVNDVA